MSLRPSLHESTEEISSKRIQALQEVGAKYIARSYATCMSAGPHLPHVLKVEQDNYYREFAKVSPVHVIAPEQSILTTLESFNVKGGPVMIIANHPPYEKTISPSREQVASYLRILGKEDLVEGVKEHLPAVIARRAVISNTLDQILPGFEYQFHVVGAEFYDPPMSTIQQQDGTIIVPYEPKSRGGGGFPTMYIGMRNVFEQSQTHPKPIVVAFPEGGSSRTGIEKLSQFHNGPFSAAQLYATEYGASVVMIPMVMGVRSDLSSVTEILQPFQLRHDKVINPHALALTLSNNMQTEYDHLLGQMGEYFWKGMKYPYGGPGKEEIVKQNQ